MIKAVFLDYTGTIVQLRGSDFDELTTRFVEGSTVKTSEEAVKWFYDHLRKIERECYQDTFMSEDELMVKILDQADVEVKLKENHSVLTTVLKNFWMYAPLYSDVRPFFSSCDLPIYILMDNASGYANICLRRNGLHANGVISGEDVKAYKPRKEIFEKALEMSGYKASEVIHVGDDLEGDVEGAKGVGIEPILLDRTSKYRGIDCRRIRSLTELLPLIQRENEKQ